MHLCFLGFPASAATGLGAEFGLPERRDFTEKQADVRRSLAADRIPNRSQTVRRRLTQTLLWARAAPWAHPWLRRASVVGSPRYRPAFPAGNLGPGRKARLQEIRARRLSLHPPLAPEDEVLGQVPALIVLWRPPDR